MQNFRLHKFKISHKHFLVASSLLISAIINHTKHFIINLNLMQNQSILLEKLNLKYPLLGVYDAPPESSFKKLIAPPENKRICMFAYFNQWAKGKTLKLSKDNSGCKGCGYWWFNKESQSQEDFVKFLVEDEGLKDTNDKMEQWLLDNNTYKPEYDSIFVGPIDDEFERFVKTITFWVNADQLSVLSLAAYYFNESGSKPPIMTPFGSGCMQALTLFEDFEQPRAIIGSMDIAMRQYLPSNYFAFTVTLPLFKLFMNIDEKSFLNKPFLSTLLKTRGGTL